MLALIIGFLMSLGIIGTEVEYNNLSEVQKEQLISEWVEDNNEGI
jgi:hypothetical protein